MGGGLLISDEVAQTLKGAITDFYNGEADNAMTLIKFGLFFVFLGYVAIGSEARVEGYLRKHRREKSVPNTLWWRFQKHLYDWYRPASYPLIAVGFVEIVCGAITYVRSGLQTKLLVEEVFNYTQEFLDNYAYTDPYHLLSFEKVRVSEILLYYLIMEQIVPVAILLSCLGLLIGCLKDSLGSIYSVAIGILPQAIFLYFNNSDAQHRTQVYFDIISAH